MLDCAGLFLFRGTCEVYDSEAARSRSSVTSRDSFPSIGLLPSGADKSIVWYPGRLVTLMKEKREKNECAFFYFETGDGEVSTKPNLALALALAQTKPDRPSDPAYLHLLSSLIDQIQRWVKAAQNLFGHTVLPMLVCHLNLALPYPLLCTYTLLQKFV